MVEPEKTSSDSFQEQINKESEKLGKAQKERLLSEEKSEPKTDNIDAIMPYYNPLEDHIISFSMMDESLEMLLYTMAQAVGMSLIIDPEVNVDNKKLTLNFRQVSAAIVLKEITEAYDLFYEIDENVIRVMPYRERIFKLNFLDTDVTTTFKSGGSVQDSEGSGGGSSGYFKMEGQSASQDKGNAYDVIDKVVQDVKSPGGRYSLNRLGGSLYVKDKPAVIESISKLIIQFKNMMARQILIEARIIEVSLSDDYKYGIDWKILRRSDNIKGLRLSRIENSITGGLVLGGIANEFDINVTINALKTFGETKVVSNPSIRTKHGKSAVISVGTRIAYTKSVTTTQATDTTAATSEPQAGNVFDGLILGVIPFIEDNGKITLMINPIKSDVDATSLELLDFTGGNQITLPRVNVKEINTTIVVNSGDVVILGGLIDNRRSIENKGVPFLASLPGLGYLFKNEITNEETRELVIFLRVKIL